MSDIFISYVEEDKEVATQIAEMLESARYTTWAYESHGIPGLSFISQITQTIAESKAMVLVISVQAMSSQHVEAELFQAYSKKKHIIPLLIGINYDEVKGRRPDWATMLGATVSVPVDARSVAKIIPRIIKSLEAKGIYPSAGKEPKPAEELRTDQKPSQSSRPDRRDSKRKKSLIIIGAALALAVLIIIIVAVIASQSGNKSSHTANTGLPTSPPTITTTLTPASTPKPTATSTLKDILSFSENFDDGQADGWNLGSGWSVVSDNGNYVLDGQTESASPSAWPYLTSAENYQLEADVMLISGTLQIHVRVGNNDYGVLIRANKISLLKGDGIRLIGSWNSVNLELNQWHKVKIALNGGNIKVYIDQNLSIDCQDPNPLPGGTMYLGVCPSPGETIQHVRVDNIVIQPN